MHPPPETTSIELVLRVLGLLTYGSEEQKTALRKLCHSSTWHDASGALHSHRLLQPEVRLGSLAFPHGLQSVNMPAIIFVF